MLVYLIRPETFRVTWKLPLVVCCVILGWIRPQIQTEVLPTCERVTPSPILSTLLHLHQREPLVLSSSPCLSSQTGWVPQPAPLSCSSIFKWIKKKTLKIMMVIAIELVCRHWKEKALPASVPFHLLVDRLWHVPSSASLNPVCCCGGNRW